MKAPWQTARWLQLAARIDALSERERLLSFGAAVAVVVFGVKATVLGPMAAKEAMLRSQMQQQQQAARDIDRSIAEQISAAAIDPDRAAREQLLAVQAESERMANQLRTMQRGLVAPERMAPLLESMLRANGKLRLVGMRTLPATPLSSIVKDGQAQPAASPPPPPAAGPSTSVAPAGGAAAAVAPTPALAEPELLYRHGVELTVRGSYLDMVDYMTTLEGLPTQLFWGKAQLEVEQYPTVRLTLTLYTISLDDKWMKL